MKLRCGIKKVGASTVVLDMPTTRLAEVVTPERYGAKGDGVTDDTTAIQEAINYVANQGRITLQGVGRSTKANYSNDKPIATILESNDATGPAIYCNGDPLGADTNHTNQVQIRNLSIWVSNTTSAIQFDRVVQNSGFEQVYINQAGSGSGIDWHTIWVGFLRDIRVDGGGKATSDTGIYLRNLAVGTPGGFIDMQTVIANDFGIGIQLGHKTYGTGGRLHSINMLNVQGGDATTGIVCGHGIDQVNMIGSHMEDCDVGLSVIMNAQAITMSGGSVVNSDVGLKLGDGTANGNRYRNIRIENVLLISDAATTRLIDVYSSSNTKNLTIENVQFTGHASATDTAIYLEDVNHHNLRVISPKFGTNLTTEINKPERVQELVQEQSVIWRTVNTSGALSAVPFNFCQDSSAGAQPVALIKQRDGSEQFIEFEVPITPGDNLNAINTRTGDGAVVGPQAKLAANGWAFYGMIKMKINTSAGTKDLFLPLFESDLI